AVTEVQVWIEFDGHRFPRSGRSVGAGADSGGGAPGVSRTKSSGRAHSATAPRAPSRGALCKWGELRRHRVQRRPGRAGSRSTLEASMRPLRLLVPLLFLPTALA